MDKTAKLDGGGTEGEEWMAASTKVVKGIFTVFNPQTFNMVGGSTFNGKTDTTEAKWWRHFESNKIFTNIQQAIDSLG
jgi:hypothetical protein